MKASEMQSETGQVTDTRRAVFIELREKGSESFVARSSGEFLKQRASHRRHSYPSDYRFPYDPITILSDIHSGDFVETYFTPKSNNISVKLAKFQNIITPYIISRSRVESKAETVLELPNFVVQTTLRLRRSFAQDVYKLALDSGEPMHKIAALKAMEQLFIAMVSANEISYKIAEKRFNTCEALQARMWRSTFPGEQVACFNQAWRIFASVTNLKQTEAKNA